MADQRKDSRYPWTRFWHPVSEAQGVEERYLQEPEAWRSSGALYRLSDLGTEQCLLLLGEPGMGKSTELYSAYNETNAVARGDDVTMYVQLRDVDSLASLDGKLTGKPEFRSWLGASHRLTLFLDSMDEGLIGVPTLASALMEAFSELPLDRLSLRLASRGGDWLTLVSGSLAARIGSDRVLTLQLAPLREADVRIAATQEGVRDVDGFLREIALRDVGALAARPVTLRLLLTLFLRDGTLPNSRMQLYDDGCLLLATEVSKTRKAAGRYGKLSERERLAIAARIAFVLTFANKGAVWTGPNYGDLPESDVMIDAIVGEVETAAGVRVKVGPSEVREVLDTALFSPRGENRVGFSHQTYAEHLAAWYVAQHKMDWRQIVTLLVHSGDPDKRVVPQLRETAARLAERSTALRERILCADPTLLLMSDLAAAPAEHRKSVVSALLEETRRNGVSPVEKHRVNLSALSHPDLETQLRAVMSNPAENHATIDLAVDIAVACSLTGLSSELAGLATDSSRLFRSRLDGAYAVIRIGDSASRMTLKQLALRPEAADDYDQLKGCGLLAAWPDHMSIDELVPALTRPQHPSHFGPYERFLHDFGESVSERNLAVLLPWAASHASEEGSFGAAVTGVLRTAWDNLEKPGVLKPFAVIAAQRLRDRERIIDDNDRLLQRRDGEQNFDTALASNVVRRRLLLNELVHLMDQPADAVRLAYAKHTLVEISDIAWLIQQLRLAIPDLETRWAELIWSVFVRDGMPMDAADIVYGATSGVDADASLKERFTPLFEPIELGSSRAAKLKAEAAEIAKWQTRGRQSREGHPATTEQVTRLLDRVEAGDVDAWWQLTRYIARDEPGTIEETHYLNPADRPIWALLDAATRARMISAAHRYVQSRSADAEQWLGQKIMHWPAAAGYRALLLLQREAPELVADLSATTWSAWAPILVAFPAYGSPETLAPVTALVAQAYRAAPDSVIATVSAVIDEDDRENKALFVVERLDGCWDDRLSAALLNKVRDQSLSSNVTEQLLHQLITHGDTAAESYVAGLLRTPLPTTAEERERILMAGRVLLSTRAASGATVVWPAMQNDADFGQELLLSIATHSDDLIPDIVRVWPEDALADLYLWLERQFPQAEDPKPEGVFTPGPRFNIGQWRHGLRNVLVHKGTTASVNAVARIYRALPTPWHAEDLHTAKEVFRRTTWSPPVPKQLLRMADNATTRLVRDGGELLRVVRESLNRFQTDLLGENPLARLLWSPQSDGKWRPRDEGDLADAIERHLHTDLQGRGIVAGREIVIRRGAGKGVEGDRTDIYVFAVVSGKSETDFDTASVIVEVKCSWNDEVETAIESQLVGQYLARNQRCHHGLYVAGWYSSPVSDTSDPRLGKASRFPDRKQLGQKLRERARSASIGPLTVRALTLDLSLQKQAPPRDLSSQPKARKWTRVRQSRPTRD